MTAEAVRVRGSWLQWWVRCDDHTPPFWRQIRGNRATAVHVADIHNQHHHPTPESAE